MSGIGGKKYSVKQFAEKMCLQPEYVRQMCRGQGTGRTGIPARLPDGWAAEKAGRDWWIYELPKSTRKRMQDALERLAAEGEDREPYSRPEPTLPEDPTDYSPNEESLWIAEQDIFDHWFLEAKVHRLVPGPSWTRTGPIDRFVDLFAKNSVTDPEQKQMPNQLQDGAGLLERLKLCYQYAVLNESDTSINIAFEKSGGWRITKATPIAPFLINSVQYDNRFDVAYWISELMQKRSGKSRPIKHVGQRVSCINCGKQIVGRKSDALFCGDGKVHSESKKTRSAPESESSCRTQHGDWIKAICDLPPAEIANRIVKRFALMWTKSIDDDAAEM